ncbi:MAG: hypothetical protein KC731_38685 [Myxococcales bacterium]|nr:hypothetical protein [Myxococcales bacterium]
MSGPKGGLTRLNYFNGMRLEAPDFRVEQAYHIDVRRRLMRALFSSGIAEGLEVSIAPDKHHLVIGQGLALDEEGRVIAIDEPTEVAVRGVPSSDEGWIFGNYLVARYDEHTEVEAQDGCRVENGCCETAWGGPTRIVARPDLSFQHAWPKDGVVLAQVELDESCAVKSLRTGVRKYATPVTSAARSFALEGEREIDEHNPKRLYFHLEGPTRSVMLYLRAAKFSTLFYSELGVHSHALDTETKNAGAAPPHTHPLGDATLSLAGEHSHGASANVDEDGAGTAFEIDDPSATINLAQLGLSIAAGGEHTHAFEGDDPATGPGGALPSHHHAITGVSTEPQGQPPVSARVGESIREYVEGLEVWVDNQNLTPNILAHLGGAPNWAALGDGTAAHLLVTEGTAIGIPLDRLGMNVTAGAHLVELRVTKGGGTIHYNLYVA